MENQCAARQSHRLQGQTLPHPLMPGSLPSPAHTNHLEFQVWDRGHSTGQFPAARALSLGPAGLCWHVEAGAELCWLLMSAGAATVPSRARAGSVGSVPDGVSEWSECAPDTGLGCREKLNSPAPTALGLLCSPPTAGAKARSKVQVLPFRALPGR